MKELLFFLIVFVIFYLFFTLLEHLSPFFLLCVVIGALLALILEIDKRKRKDNK